MGVFKKQWVYWIDYYVSGRRKWERIGAEKNLAEAVWSGGRRSHQRSLRAENHRLR
jgi:hypothetical protein